MAVDVENDAPSVDSMDATIAEAVRLSYLAVEILKGCRERAPEHPRPSVRAATLLRCAAEILGDLAG
jgi:hypothetical protein